VLGVVLALCLLLAVTLGGVALLLLAAIPPEHMHLPWLLWVVPLVPLLIAGAAWAALRSRASEWSLDPLRSQIASDAALLREAGEA
jgi:cytochrome c-type biogenesis protein CcmH/NrfF